VAASPSTTICSGTNVTFTATPTNGGTPSYQWKLNGSNVGSNSATYSTSALANGNTVSVVMTSTATCATGSPATSNTVTMTVNPNLPASVSVAASPSTTICSGTNVTFTATPTNGGTPSYQWKLNGSNVGTNSASYSNNTLANGDLVSVVMTSTATCATGSPATSNTVTLTVNSNLPASVSIGASPSTTICSGTNVTFTATPTNGGTPSYQWKLNGSNVGSNSATYSTSALANGNTVSVVMTSTATCATGSPATSNTVTMTVNPNLPASVSVAASPSTTICSGTNVTFTATPTNGGTPSYQWKLNGSNVGSNSATYSTSALATGNTVSVMLTSTATCATGSPATSNTVTINVNPPSVGGTVTGGNSVCLASASGLLTLTGNTGTIIRWEQSTAPFSSWTVIANTASTYTAGTVTQTTQFRAVVQSGACAETNSSATTVTVGTTTWNGTYWNNGTPTSTTAAVIEGDYTSSSTLTACTLTVTNSSTVIISDGNSVILNGALTVESGSAFTLENNANLLQNGSSNLNSGAITVKRFSSALKRQDYTLWSSPTTGSQKLLDFSPATLANRFYNYDSATNFYVAIPSPSTTTFATAAGYLIRMPNTHPATATVWESGAFVGVPNTGNYAISMTDGGAGQRFNLVGNPYPSPIDATAFVGNATNAANTTSTLYFWRKTNNAASQTYCTWTSGGFVPNGEAAVFDPNNIIQIGQGFFVEASGNGTAMVFDNTMRTDDHTGQFFRTASPIERNRIWLNATGTGGLFSQVMVGYMTDATNDVDATDGKYINDGAIAFTSLINETAYTIQGRSLPFDAMDSVPMQFKAAAAGLYSISIDHVDGLFTGAQDIYLRDTQTGLDHDLKSGAYSFTSDAGTFANRFFVVYTAALSVEHPVLTANTIVVYKNENATFTVNSGAVIMQSVNVFDIRGRLLSTQNNINSNQTILTVGQANEVLLIQVTSTDGTTVTKKVIR
ncbi:T9SS sorting signal type C domain-containing protein, partial [Flavobacterium sp.]